ncbi:hypothetical protein IJ380_02005 [Candidatus Saccharibacteria bacterium]|nr:hypothetical protein [Candidatus Saccharibacteria bacterium]
MSNLKRELRRLYFRLKHDYFSFDNVVFFVAIVLCFFWTYSSISAMSRNWELSQKIATRRSELELLNREVQILELENAYYRSAEYQELSARAKQNKKLEGENLVYLPENSEAAKKKYDTLAVAEEVVEPSNFSQWMSFLFGV